MEDGVVFFSKVVKMQPIIDSFCLLLHGVTYLLVVAYDATLLTAEERQKLNATERRVALVQIEAHLNSNSRLTLKHLLSQQQQQNLTINDSFHSRSC